MAAAGPQETAEKSSVAGTRVVERVAATACLREAVVAVVKQAAAVVAVVVLVVAVTAAVVLAVVLAVEAAMKAVVETVADPIAACCCVILCCSACGQFALRQSGRRLGLFTLAVWPIQRFTKVVIQHRTHIKRRAHARRANSQTWGPELSTSHKP